MIYKELLSAAAIVLTFIAFFPYIRSIMRGNTRPHVFSWVIWGITTLVVFLAQLKDDGGLGAWPTGLSGVITFYVACIAYLKTSDIAITRGDWIFFLAALSSLPFWYFTSDPLWAVVILTAVDVLGFGPTIRKAYSHPFQEDIVFFTLFAVRGFFSVGALENFSLTTVLFPAAVSLACLLLVLMVIYRRRLLREKKPADYRPLAKPNSGKATA